MSVTVGLIIIWCPRRVWLKTFYFKNQMLISSNQKYILDLGQTARRVVDY